MTDESSEIEKGKPAVDVNSVPSQHAVFVVPITLLQPLTDYLTTKPYREVAQFLQALSQIPSQDQRVLKMTAGVKKSKSKKKKR